MNNGEVRATALGYLRKSLDQPTATFREGQWEAIEAILARKRLLVVQRTGWGKSVVYFLATRLMRDHGAGPTLLVSPLLSLMRDQIKAAERIDRILELRRAEQREMQDYVETSECLMQYLARTLDDPYAKRCGRCSNCVGEPLISPRFEMDVANAAVNFLKHAHEAIAPRRMWPAGGLSGYGFHGRIGPKLTAESGKALARWGDAGWGERIREGKYVQLHFDDELVAACEELVRQWSPRPRPQWITCVPSNRHQALVPDFARRLAERLGLPFWECVRKTGENRPQKEMENSAQQARNLDGIFEVSTNQMPSGPVLLIDDMIDSGWTLTVTAALLRQAGASAVFPLVLANTKGTS